MLSNAYFLAKIGADTAENEQHFAEILPTDGAVATATAKLELHFEEAGDELVEQVLHRVHGRGVEVGRRVAGRAV